MPFATKSSLYLSQPEYTTFASVDEREFVSIFILTPLFSAFIKSFVPFLPGTRYAVTRQQHQ